METIFDYNQIKQIIPHRQPFLLIDKIVEYEEGKRCVGLKQVSGNEPFFQGHFPNYAVMPGVLITEVLLVRVRLKRLLMANLLVAVNLLLLFKMLNLR